MAKEPTFRLLDGAYLGDAGNALSRDRLSLGAKGIKLAESAVSGSPLSLDSSDGSLGRLALPPGMAVDVGGVLYLLGPGEPWLEAPWIKRFDPPSGRFEKLKGVGGEGSDARLFHQPTSIAIAERNLYVADRGNRRVQVFALDSLALRYVWEDFDTADVSSGAGMAFFLDQEDGCVYRHIPGQDEPILVLDSSANAGRWSRLLVDAKGGIYLLDAAKLELSNYSPAGVYIRTISSAGDVRDDFAVPAVVLNNLGLFAWAGSFFDRTGRSSTMDPASSLGPKLYESEGVWISRVEDSGIYRCPWHRVEVNADLPTGTRIVISSFTDNRMRSDEDILALDAEWETRFMAVSPLQTNGVSAQSTDFLLQSVAGQYLWLRAELVGDGFASPSLQLLRIHYPRQTYLEYLPAVYGSDEEGRRFLENYLSVFKTEWDRLEAQNESVASYFDPKAVGAQFVDWLATWLALPLEQSWTAEQKRRLLMAVPKLYPRMGTPDGVQAYLRAYLENMGGEPLPEGYPIVVEGFRRRRQMLSLDNSALGRAGQGAQLWSNDVVGRLQLGEVSRLGQARIVSTGSPDTDVFQVYAHRFQVFVPAGYVKTANDERMLRRALDTARPAHTAYDLVLVAPRFRIGVQSSVGLDTVIGNYPQARLSSTRQSEATAPSGPPQNRLSYDTVLAPLQGDDAGFTITRHGVRAGVNTILN